jgi:hypothetical protein
MEAWLMRIANSLADQAGIWFVSLVVGLLGVFSARLVGKVKFALNRADLRTKYYEELATELSTFIFAVDRLVKVYYKASWLTDADKTAMSAEYDQAMNKISRKEYVYLSWLHHYYWGNKTRKAFALTMGAIRDVDSTLIALGELKENSDRSDAIQRLEAQFSNLQRVAQELLRAAI